MKTKLILLSLLILTTQYSLLNSAFWEVNRDGTGDFITIQAAVNNAAEGDSILVHPGRYVENIDYLGKSISLFSLAISTGNDEYIGQTIIDGDDSDSVVYIDGCTDAYLGGFTLTNGFGRRTGSIHNYSFGGGVQIRSSSVTLEDCLIINNRADYGGGSRIVSSSVLFKGNTITNNTAVFGGGLHIAGPSEVENAVIFDIEKKNNIFKNSGIEGHEIRFANIPYLDVQLGKANVTHQDPYFYYVSNNCGEVTVSAETAVLEQVANDLYVATWGCNDNSGLTPADPLQSIAFALMKVNADSLNPRTIYIEEGVYSPSETGEMLPLHLKPYVTLTSLDEQTRWTVDAEVKSSYAASRVDKGDITVRNAIFKRGIPKAGAALVVSTYGHRVVLENIDLENRFSGGNQVAFGASRSKELIFRNINVFGNDGIGVGVSICSSCNSRGVIDRVLVENIQNGTGITMIFKYGETKADFVISNTLINNCYLIDNFLVGGAINIAGASSYIPIGTRRIRMINNTIANNEYRFNSIRVSEGILAEFYNNIVYDNKIHDSGGYSPINLFGNHRPGRAHFSHNLLENGLEDIRAYGDFPFTYNNILSGNPLFLGEGEHPYELSEGSPAINAGTTDIPGYTFEEYDLAGNPRIVDGRIDLGAYEYQRTNVEAADEDSFLQARISSISYPNPVSLNKRQDSFYCTISFNITLSGDIIVAVYNAKGQRVRTLLNGFIGKGQHNIRWDGTNNRGKRVGTGIYMYKIETETLEDKGTILIVK